MFWGVLRSSKLFKSNYLHIDCQKRVLISYILPLRCYCDLRRIASIFPNPRVTLNELATKLPHKVFELRYRECAPAPKSSGSKKRLPAENGWICYYSFVWPDKMQFESTALSKKQAAEKAAHQALQWLYSKKRIDRHGKPLLDFKEIDKLTSGANEPLYAFISEDSVKKVEKLWSDYEREIKSIYDKTHEDTKASDLISTNLDNVYSNIDVEGVSRENHPVFACKVAPSSESALIRRDIQLKRIFERYEEEIDELPIDGFRDQITSAIDQSESRTIIITGEPGCGKSTRVPTILLKHYGSKCNAIVSEPRRVAAISLAERVATEMGEEIGSSIGYQVRLESCPPRPPGGAVSYCTSGVLLRKLQADPALKGCTIAILDEAHIRGADTDLTMLLLKRALKLNPELKVVLMSATLDVGVFSRYFGSPPIIEVPGRTYPVEAIYLEEIRQRYNLSLSQTLESSAKVDGRPVISCNEIAEVIIEIDKKEPEGGILVFLPGWAEIKNVKKILEEHFVGSGRHFVIPVHSKLSTEDQSLMFKHSTPMVRKIILATNIAECSITVPGVGTVVDCGGHRETNIIRTGIPSLDLVWISKSAAKQRMGRAGRVRQGRCYKMYTKEKEESFIDHIIPEILRIPLDKVVLDCKSYAPEMRVEQFLSQLPEPPSGQAVQQAVDDLIDLGALTTDESLTPLGLKLSAIPLSPRIAVSLLHSACVGNVRAVALVAVGANVGGDNIDVRELKRKYSNTSDYTAMHLIQEEFENNISKKKPISELLNRERLLNAKAIKNLHKEYLQKTIPMRIVEEIEELDKHTNSEQMLSGVLLSGGHKLIVSRKRLSTKGRIRLKEHFYTSKSQKVHISSESVNYNASTVGSVLMSVNLRHGAARAAFVATDTCVISPKLLVLFARGGVQVLNNQKDDANCILRLTKVNLDICVPKNQTEVILKAREMIWKTFQFYYEKNLDCLDLDTENLVFNFKKRLFEVIEDLLLDNDRNSKINNDE